MDDSEVIQAFLQQGAKRSFGRSLHIEGDALFLSGWWHAAFRVSDGVFAVRDEEPREEAPVLEDLVAALGAMGLTRVAVDHPLIQPITYTELSLGQVSWALWAADLAAAEAALQARAGAETFFTDASFADEPPESADFSAELGGARRVAGLPAALVLTVGLEDQTVKELGQALDDVRVESRSFETFPPSACGALIPGVIVVDASGDTGREFIMELRTEACGRFIPVAAVTESAETPLGADETLDSRVPPAAWVAPLRALLP
ncbi:MAG: hypothetical protein ACRD0S_09660 [Acidimicrobiales bacterium]